MAKENEDDVLNPCGHRTSERVEALKELPSSVCPACLLEQIKEVEAENKKLRRLLKDALPHIECKNNSQSSLITEIGEYLSKALEGNKGKGNEDGKDADSCIA